MSLLVGARVGVVHGGKRLLGNISFDNEDGTIDIISDDGMDLDGIPIGNLVSSTDDATIADGLVLPAQPGLLTGTVKKKTVNALRFVCISDTHGLHRRVGVPDGDVLLHAGDFTNTGEREQVQDFHDWLATLPHKWKVVIAGNHDITMDAEYYLKRGARRFHGGVKYDPQDVRSIMLNSKDVIYLEDQAFQIPHSHGPINIWGSPYQPEFCDWAFNLSRGDQTRQKAQQIPANVDILVTHGPPAGHGDHCSAGNRSGCTDLLHEVLTRVQPIVHVFGHIHEGYGVSSDGGIAFVNGSTCNHKYRPDNLPIIFDLCMHEDRKLVSLVFRY